MSTTTSTKNGLANRILGTVERIGNKLPDPSLLFIFSTLIVWILSALLSNVEFSEVNPRDGSPLIITNLLSGSSLTAFLSNMVTIFTSFAPLGVVLVAMLGVGVADGSGYIHTGLKMILNRTPGLLITPMVIFVGILSHSAVDAGYVLVIPLGGIIFLAAGRHPLAGIAAAFAGVSGGFSASPLPTAVDAILQSFTQPAAQIIDPGILVNPLCNYFFTSTSTLLIVLIGWYITDRVIEPRLLKNHPVNNSEHQGEDMKTTTKLEVKGFWIATGVMGILLILFVLSLLPESSPFRDESGLLSSFSAPVMKSIVPLIFLFFLIPGIIYGRVTCKYANSKDIIDQMTESMKSMSYYIVMAFFCSLFINAFGTSGLGALLAIKGANFLSQLHLPGPVTITGIILLAAFVNIFVGSASAKWALLAPIFVPMLMQMGYSPELTQAAYRVGDSSTNIITPLLPYFPLVVVFCQNYVKKTGIGTLTSIMLPYSLTFLLFWTMLLILFWVFGIPLGLQAGYTYGV